MTEAAIEAMPEAESDATDEQLENAPGQEDVAGETLGESQVLTEGPNTRDRSTIRFPYGDLDSAVEVALAVSRYGLDCSAGQLAATLDVDGSSAGYRARVSTAAVFEMIETVKGGGVKLTPLGRRLADPDQLAAAKAEAFLTVPLYGYVFRLFETTVLPGDQGLEAEMIKAGVAPKVVKKARQAFVRSADQAGFFAAGRTRLVRPAGSSVDVAPEPRREDEAAQPPPPSLKETVVSNALLAALFSKMLPEDETADFPVRDRNRLFRALAVNLDVIYGEPRDGELDADALARLFKPKDGQDAARA